MKTTFTCGFCKTTGEGGLEAHWNGCVHWLRVDRSYNTGLISGMKLRIDGLLEEIKRLTVELARRA